MNAIQTVIDEHPARVKTKIAGTTFEGRQDLLAQCKIQNIIELALTPEPDNRYDCHAVAVEADLIDRFGSNEIVRLGYLSNSERVCADCGVIVGGSLFERTRTLRCIECDHIFTYHDPVVARRGESTIIECPICKCGMDLELAKFVTCPGCGGTDFGRGGLATRISRAIACGVSYGVRVIGYTGGDIGPDGKRKSLGCNIHIERISD